MAILAVLRSRRAGCEHCRLPSGTRVGRGRVGRPVSAPAGATPRASEQSRRRRSTDDHRIRAPLAIAQQERCARSVGRSRGGRPAAAVTVATTDASESRCQGEAPGSEEASHRRQATASPTSRLTTDAAPRVGGRRRPERAPPGSRSRRPRDSVRAGTDNRRSAARGSMTRTSRDPSALTSAGFPQRRSLGLASSRRSLRAVNTTSYSPCGQSRTRCTKRPSASMSTSS